jgi:hypothetical protein
VDADEVDDELDEEPDDVAVQRGTLFQRIGPGTGGFGAALGAAMSEVGAFTGAGRAWQEEKESRDLRRDEDDEGAPPLVEVDLDSGVARVRRPRDPGPG